MSGWGTWDANWTWSLVLIAVTITIHASGVVLIATAIARLSGNARLQAQLLQTRLGAVAAIVGVAVSLVILHGVECLIWAFVYVQLGALASPADAVLYSVDSMTTRGASGLMLERHWRMMGAAEAGDGMLLFGISTAFIFTVMQAYWALMIRTHLPAG